MPTIRSSSFVVAAAIGAALCASACGKTEAPPPAGPAAPSASAPASSDPVLRALPMPQRFPDPRTLPRRDGGPAD
jgi:hypothetical protein